MKDEEDKYTNPSKNPWALPVDESGNPIVRDDNEETDMNPERLIPVWDKDKKEKSK